jgi:DNA repair exonuclease SbcCD ATPase subunit
MSKVLEKISGFLPGQSRPVNSPSKGHGKGVHDDQNAQHPDRNNGDHQPSGQAPLQGEEGAITESPISRLAYLTQENDRLEKLAKTKKKELQAELSTAEKKNERLEKELRERSTEVAKLVSEKEKIKDLLLQAERVSNDRADLIRRENQANNYLKSVISDREHQLQGKTLEIQTMSGNLHTKSVEIEFQKGEVRALQNRIESMQATESSLRSDLNSVRSQKLQMEQSMQNEISHFKRLQNEALVTIEQLRFDAEEYSGALLKRDAFTPTTDRDMKSMFREISQDVETLARVEWQDNQTVWTPRALQVMSPHHQSFKKQVLQDMIWGILQQYIFASPFRPFGEEGQKLETAWKNLDPELKAEEGIGMGSFSFFLVWG